MLFKIHCLYSRKKHLLIFNKKRKVALKEKIKMRGQIGSVPLTV